MIPEQRVEDTQLRGVVLAHHENDVRRQQQLRKDELQRARPGSHARFGGSVQ